MPRFSITVKNAIVYFVLLVFTSVILGYSIYRISSNIILENATLSLNHNNESVVTQFRTFLKDIQRDIHFISKDPFLYQFINNPDNQELKSKLSAEFLALLSTNKHYLQLRLIGIEDDGKEIIRAEKFANNFGLVDPDHLQKKGDRDYFIETIQLPEDSVYVSEINLNQEYGKIIMPMVPTLRMAKPIYINGKPFGIVIINVDLSYVFDELKNIAGNQFTLTLFNNSGYYLIHPDSSKTFGFEFKQPPAIDLLKLDKQSFKHNGNKTDEQELYYIIPFSYPRTNYHLFFSLSADKNVLLSVFNQWKFDILLLTIIMTLLSLSIAIWWTQRQTKVFKTLTNTIINFGKNQEDVKMHIDRDDEIGDLSKSFRDMANKINQHLNELQIAKTEAIDANKAKQEFLENMSHEIRNPLQSILGMTGMLSQNNPRPDQQVFIDTLKFSSENLLTLVNDILDYRKLIHGQIELHFQEVSIKEFLDNIIKSHLFEAANKKVKFSLQLDQKLRQKNFTTDSVRLSQILHNLISNAIRNTPSGKEVHLNVNSNDDSKLEFSVIDHGVGLSEENIQNILQQRPVTGFSRQMQNVGLGLPIVINMLKLFESTLIIQSTLGTGSVFQFSLNSKLNDAPVKKIIKNTFTDSLNCYLKSIACIEDDAQNAFFYQQVFEKAGIQTNIFDSPEQFVNQSKQSYDLIITDLNFENEHLDKNLQKIQSYLIDKGLMILVSGAEDIHNSSSSDSSRFDASFIKPVSAELLLNEITRLVFQKYFDNPKLEKLYINYDFERDKVKQALELVINEWKDMSAKLNDAIQRKDFELFDKVYHKLINSMRTFELIQLQQLLDETRLQLIDKQKDSAIIANKVSLPLNYYQKIFEEEWAKLKLAN